MKAKYNAMFDDRSFSAS